MIDAKGTNPSLDDMEALQQELENLDAAAEALRLAGQQIGQRPQPQSRPNRERHFV